MVTLNDYLYSGDTVLRILYKYSADLREDAAKRIVRKARKNAKKRGPQ